MKSIKVINEKEYDTPQIMYEVVADMGDYGTSTIFTSHVEHSAREVLDKVLNNDGCYYYLEDNGINIEDIENLSIQMTLEVPQDTVQVVTFGETEQVMLELYSCDIEK